ncbi:MAG: T9SS type A sorting domain-containing protein [Lentimicrobium sp.]
MKTKLPLSVFSFFLLLGIFTSTYAQVQVISPNGGENWVNGTEVSVVWTNDGELDYYSIEYSYDNGSSWFVLDYVYGVAGTNESSWILNFLATDEARIRVSNYFNPAIYDESDNTFSVSNPPYYIYTPYQGAVLYQNSEIIVQWYTENSNPVYVDFSADNGQTWTRVGSGVTGQIFYFDAPAVNSNQCLVRVSDVNDPAVSGQSPLFSIVPTPEITLITPNGGETWNYGGLNTVTWTGSNLNNSIDLEYSSDGGITWQVFWYGESSPDGGSIQVETPMVNTGSARIKISDTYYPGANDISDANFTINVPPFIIYSPTAGYSYYTDQTLTVSWFAFEAVVTNIEISLDNGLTFQTLATDVPSYTGYRDVELPSSASENCILKIVDSSNPDSYALSEVFRIIQAPVLALVQPNGGELWDNDSTYSIEWTYTGELPEYTYLMIEFSPDNGNNWEYIGFLDYYGSENSFSWRTPVQTSDSCLIRISDYYYPSISATSQSAFSIKDIPIPDICMVSVDVATGKNVIVWNKVESELISEYVIMKESNESNVYQEIGSVGASELSSFLDNESNPREKATRYKLSFRDSEGNLYGSGSLHQTIHLSINQGVGNTWNLNWNPYLGFPVTSYNIYRGSNPSEMQMLGTVSGNFTSYTDLNALPGFVYYMIEVINPGGSCNPEGLKTGNYSSSTSNIATNNTLGVQDKALLTGLTVYPNPASEKIKVITTGDLQGEIVVTIVSSTGTIVDKIRLDSEDLVGGYELSVQNLQYGIYTLRVTDSKSAGSVRFIRN